MVGGGGVIVRNCIIEDTRRCNGMRMAGRNDTDRKGFQLLNQLLDGFVISPQVKRPQGVTFARRIWALVC